MNTTNVPFMLIHSDVLGPAPVVGMHDFLYYVMFIDDYTRINELDLFS